MEARVTDDRTVGWLRRLLAGISLTVALAAPAAIAVPVPAADAATVNLSACNLSPLSQPFVRYGDAAWYELAPGGDFETSTWALSGGARRVAGSEPYAATGTLGEWSLELPAGASALSPSTCVDAAYPTLRFFVAGSGLLAVSVVYGNLTLPAGVAVVAGAWAPTTIMLTDSALTALSADGSAQVSLRLTSLAGDVRVDDVFVDPWNRG